MQLTNTRDTLGFRYLPRDILRRVVSAIRKSAQRYPSSSKLERMALYMGKSSSERYRFTALNQASKQGANTSACTWSYYICLATGQLVTISL